jgi:hypothetical protein
MALFSWSTIWFAALGLVICALVLLLIKPLRRMVLPPPVPPPLPPAELVMATQAMAAAAAAAAAAGGSLPQTFSAQGVTYSFGESSAAAAAAAGPSQQRQQQPQEPRLSATDRRLLERLPTFTIAGRAPAPPGRGDEEAGSSSKHGGGEKGEEEEEQSCIICTSALSAEGGRCVTLPCAHIQHAECSFPWLLSHGTCPECRTVSFFLFLSFSSLFEFRRESPFAPSPISPRFDSSSIAFHKTGRRRGAAEARCRLTETEKTVEM